MVSILLQLYRMPKTYNELKEFLDLNREYLYPNMSSAKKNNYIRRLANTAIAADMARPENVNRYYLERAAPNAAPIRDNSRSIMNGNVSRKSSFASTNSSSTNSSTKTRKSYPPMHPRLGGKHKKNNNRNRTKRFKRRSSPVP